MSHVTVPAAAGGAAAATLPVTGSNTLAVLVVAFALMAVGALLVRASRYRTTEA